MTCNELDQQLSSLPAGTNRVTVGPKTYKAICQMAEVVEVDASPANNPLRFFLPSINGLIIVSDLYSPEGRVWPL